MQIHWDLSCGAIKVAQCPSSGVFDVWTEVVVSSEVVVAVEVEVDESIVVVVDEAELDEVGGIEVEE